jgi:hypothetical protein
MDKDRYYFNHVTIGDNCGFNAKEFFVVRKNPMETSIKTLTS